MKTRDITIRTQQPSFLTTENITSTPSPTPHLTALAKCAAREHRLNVTAPCSGVSKLNPEDFHLAVEQSANVIIITGTSGCIVYVNPAFETTTGYSSAEVLGQNPRLLKSGEQSEEFYRELCSTLF